MSELGKRIKELRSGEGETLRSLAEKLDVGFPHLSKIENGTELPGPELLERLARELNVDPTELLLLSGRVPQDIVEVLAEKRELAPALLRAWHKGRITDAQIRRLLK